MARALLKAADFKELPIPKGFGLWWLGTYTTVPSGWAIDTAACDGRFPKSVTNVGDPVGVTGGSNTHNHTVPSHTHTVAAVSSMDYATWQTACLSALRPATVPRLLRPGRPLDHCASRST